MPKAAVTVRAVQIDFFFFRNNNITQFFTPGHVSSKHFAWTSVNRSFDVSFVYFIEGLALKTRATCLGVTARSNLALIWRKDNKFWGLRNEVAPLAECRLDLSSSWTTSAKVLHLFQKISYYSLLQQIWIAICRLK